MCCITLNQLSQKRITENIFLLICSSRKKYGARTTLFLLTSNQVILRFFWKAQISYQISQFSLRNRFESPVLILYFSPVPRVSSKLQPIEDRDCRIVERFGALIRVDIFFLFFKLKPCTLAPNIRTLIYLLSFG